MIRPLEDVIVSGSLITTKGLKTLTRSGPHLTIVWKDLKLCSENQFSVKKQPICGWNIWRSKVVQWRLLKCQYDLRDAYWRRSTIFRFWCSFPCQLIEILKCKILFPVPRALSLPITFIHSVRGVCWNIKPKMLQVQEECLYFLEKTKSAKKVCKNKKYIV